MAPARGKPGRSSAKPKGVKMAYRVIQVREGKSKLLGRYRSWGEADAVARMAVPDLIKCVDGPEADCYIGRTVTAIVML